MQFTIATVVAFLSIGSTLATPAPAPNMADLMARQTSVDTSFSINIDAASCNALTCVEVVAAAGCIVLSIAADKPETALSCIASNAEKLCGCAGCISGLGDFLDRHGVC